MKKNRTNKSQDFLDRNIIDIKRQTVLKLRVESSFEYHPKIFVNYSRKEKLRSIFIIIVKVCIKT